MATTSTLEIYLKCMETCSSQTSDMANFTPAVPMLVVLDRVQLQSKQGEAALPSFADWFVACLACV